MKTYESYSDIEAEVSFLAREQGVEKKIKERVEKWHALLADAKRKNISQ